MPVKVAPDKVAPSKSASARHVSTITAPVRLALLKFVFSNKQTPLVGMKLSKFTPDKFAPEKSAPDAFTAGCSG